jgi:mannose-1-phosphate guanylyltransferase/phosphomannomutase
VRSEGAIVGKRVDIRDHAVLHDGVAVGDECSIGAQTVLSPGVKVYPFKTIEAGAAIRSNLIWESRGITTVFGRDGAAGLVNVDIPPDVAARLGMAFGTVLPKGARVVTSRDTHPASRMIKRAIISGLTAAGSAVSDLRLALPSVNRHEMKVDQRASGLHVRASADDPDVIQVQFFEPPGILVPDAVLRSIERCYTRQEFRRVAAAEIGTISQPTRATESYLHELLESLDAEAIAGRNFRIALDYRHSPASVVMPSLIGDLAAEMVSLNGFVDSGQPLRRTDLDASLRDTGQLVNAMGADIGIVMDGPAERIWLIDEQGVPIDPETTLLMLIRELAEMTPGGDLLVPSTETSLVEAVAGGAADRVRRTTASLQALLFEAAAGGVVFAGASGGGYVFPEFLPAYDAVMSIGKVLEVVAHSGRPLSELVADLPHSPMVRTSVECPWSLKGTAMRRVIEVTKGMRVDNRDGIKVWEGDGWVQVTPDPDEPVFHVWAEGTDVEDSERLEQKYRGILEAVVSAEPAVAQTLN